MSQENRRKGETGGSPQGLGEILSRLFTARGWGRRQDRLRLEETWAASMTALGLRAEHTQVGTLRRGVLEVIVGNGVLLQELAHYHKRRLLEQLRTRLGAMPLTDLRFRAGVVQGSNNDVRPSLRTPGERRKNP